MKVNIQPTKIVNNNNNNNLEDKKIKESFDKYSELFAKRMLEEQYKNMELTKGTGSSILKGMYIDSLSSELGGKIGISDLLYDQHLRGKNGTQNRFK